MMPSSVLRPGRDAARKTRRVALALMLTACAAGSGLGCEQTNPPLMLRALELPDGGTLLGITLVRAEDGSTQVAALAEHDLFVRDMQRWRSVTARTTRAAAPRFSLSGGQRARACPDRQGGGIIGHRSQIFLLSQEVVDRAPRLWSLVPGVGPWQEVPLPTLYARSWDLTDNGGDRIPGRSDGVLRESAICLFEREDTLYLMDSTHLWRMRERPEGVIWEEVALSGVIDAQRTPGDDALPRVLRHYLPATVDRPYELLSVLGSQLELYRREQGESRWVLNTTLSVIDLAFMSSPGATPRFLMLTSDSLYYSDDLERWERTRLIDQGALIEECTALIVLDDDGTVAEAPVSSEQGGQDGEQDAGAQQGEELPPRRLPTLLVGTSQGGILRSEDGGASFTKVRESSQDMRGIEGFVQSAREGGGTTVWSATHGAGVLQSEDRGGSWRVNDSGLRATIPYVIDVSRQNELVLGADAGLFVAGLGWERGRPEWRKVLERSVSAARVDGTHAWVGTQGGVIMQASLQGGEQSVNESGVIFEEQGMLHVPHDKRGLSLASESIASITMRKSTREILARTLERGAMLSQDQGMSWLSEPTNQVLRNALDESNITSIVMADGQTRYMTSQPLREELRAQLWRTDNDGQSWRTVYTFGDVVASGVFSLHLLDDADPERLVLVTEREVRLSEDGGESWRGSELAIGGKIMAEAWQGGRLSLLLVSSEQAEVMVIEELFAGVPTIKRHILEQSSTFELEDVLALRVLEDRILFRTPTGLWEAHFGRARARQSRGVGMMLTGVAAMVLVSLAYLMLYAAARRRRRLQW